MTARRSTFGPVVLLGLGAGALAAVAGTKTWAVDAAAEPSAHEAVPGIEVADPVAAAGEMPLALALGLVLLACWGVLLVTRGLARRLVALLAAVTAVGYAATVVTGLLQLPDQVQQAIRDAGRTDAATSQMSLWFWAAAVAAVASLAATGLAVRSVAEWPEMGRRYDAPGAQEEPRAEDQTNLDLWKSMDEGHDPTA